MSSGKAVYKKNVCTIGSCVISVSRQKNPEGYPKMWTSGGGTWGDFFALFLAYPFSKFLHSTLVLQEKGHLFGKTMSSPRLPQTQPPAEQLGGDAPPFAPQAVLIVVTVAFIQVCISFLQSGWGDPGVTGALWNAPL